MKSFIHSVVKVAILAIITTTLTSCSNIGGTRVVNSATRSVSRSVTAPAAGPVRIEPNEGSWEAVGKAAEYARSHGWHQPFLFKPCKMGSEGKMGCDSDLEWMTEQKCFNFFLGLGTKSPYCGAVWVKGSPATVAYTEPTPTEGGEGGGVRVDNSVHVETGLNNLFAGATGVLQEVVRKGLVYEPICYPPQRNYRPQPNCPPQVRRQIPACPRCGVVHPGRPCAQQGGGVINRKTYRVHNNNENHNFNVNNAPRGYQPPQRYNGGGNSYRPSDGSSRPFGNGSSNAGYGGGNPGLHYY